MHVACQNASHHRRSGTGGCRVGVFDASPRHGARLSRVRVSPLYLQRVLVLTLPLYQQDRAPSHGLRYCAATCEGLHYQASRNVQGNGSQMCMFVGWGPNHHWTKRCQAHLHQIFDNAFLYNQEDSDICRQAARLRGLANDWLDGGAVPDAPPYEPDVKPTSAASAASDASDDSDGEGDNSQSDGDDSDDGDSPMASRRRTSRARRSRDRPQRRTRRRRGRVASAEAASPEPTVRNTAVPARRRSSRARRAVHVQPPEDDSASGGDSGSGGNASDDDDDFMTNRRPTKRQRNARTRATATSRAGRRASRTAAAATTAATAATASASRASRAAARATRASMRRGAAATQPEPVEQSSRRSRSRRAVRRR